MPIYARFIDEKDTQQKNAALGQPAHSSSTYSLDKGGYVASWAVDGKIANLELCFISDFELSPWIQINLGGHYIISFIRLYNRQDVLEERLHDLSLLVSQDGYSFTVCGFFKGPGITKQVVEILCEDNVLRNIVRLQITDGLNNILCLCEIEVNISL
ncbi:uncharacterized protein LOC133174935 [Saccostrea echinata]|uniref:uncharacterized protein LOC133174935 n=1 Tax=Saccostrea echinata TaxID=191078 RepID=UPI002A838B0B|nr:uncharacterized protein LOC133174935 [Saccostrea echinata]